MFIEVSDSLSISSEHIEAIEAIDDLNCLVHTTTKSFEVAMPKNVLLSFISTSKTESSETKIEKLLKGLYKK